MNPSSNDDLVMVGNGGEGKGSKRNRWWGEKGEFNKWNGRQTQSQGQMGGEGSKSKVCESKEETSKPENPKT